MALLAIGDHVLPEHMFVLVCVAGSLLTYMVWPKMWTAMMSHPNQSLFLAAVPGKSVAHSSISPRTDNAETRYDHSDAHIHLRSTLGQ